jgi:hypothetical protein
LALGRCALLLLRDKKKMIHRMRDYGISADFLAQPDDIQNAVQALRAKADAAGNLKSSKEQRVRKVAATPFVR